MLFFHSNPVFSNCFLRLLIENDFMHRMPINWARTSRDLHLKINKKVSIKKIRKASLLFVSGESDFFCQNSLSTFTNTTKHFYRQLPVEKTFVGSLNSHTRSDFPVVIIRNQKSLPVGHYLNDYYLIIVASLN